MYPAQKKLKAKFKGHVGPGFLQQPEKAVWGVQFFLRRNAPFRLLVSPYRIRQNVGSAEGLVRFRNGTRVV
jgi:hypothetical protein